MEVWRRHYSILCLCGNNERCIRHARALDTVLGSTQVAVGSAQHYDVNSRVLEVWERYHYVLGLDGTQERWFQHARALVTVLGSTQVAVGTA